MANKSRKQLLTKRKKAAETSLYQFRRWQNSNPVSSFRLLLYLIGSFLSFVLLIGLLYVSEGHDKTIVGEVGFNVLFGLSGFVLFSIVLYILRYRLFPVDEKSSLAPLILTPWALISMVFGPIVAFSVNLDRSGGHNYAYQKIQDLYTKKQRSGWHRRLGYRAKITVGGNDVDIMISREMYENVHVGGCLDVCIHSGRLGVKYIDGVELPYTVRHRISCPVN